MTGIGFLGAGTLVKEGLSVRGLTTAASIWVTAAIGILIGVGFYLPAGIATVLTLGVLSFFRLIESRIPAELYAHCSVRFKRDEVMPEAEMRRLLENHNFKVVNLNYWLDTDQNFFEYGMVIQTNRGGNTAQLPQTLSKIVSIKEFRISPTVD
jgi:putative Mg2+ transporter-C (MgtC) family protein